MHHLPRLRSLARLALVSCLATFALRSSADANTNFHNLTSSQYQAHFDLRVAQGGRLISLCLSGGNLAKHYSGVFAYDGGPPWIAAHDMTSAGYQTFYNTSKAQGFHPTILTATGSGSNARFAAVCEKNGKAGYGKHNMTFPQLDAAMDEARELGYLPRAVTSYGTSDAARFGIVFERNTTGVEWLVNTSVDDSWLSYHWDIHRALGYRPAHLAVSAATHAYQVIWVEETVPEWKGYHSLTWSYFDNRDDYLTAQGHELRLITQLEIPSASSPSYMTSRYAGIWYEE